MTREVKYIVLLRVRKKDPCAKLVNTAEPAVMQIIPIELSIREQAQYLSAISLGYIFARVAELIRIPNCMAAIVI
jgi:hypothetical protein